MTKRSNPLDRFARDLSPGELNLDRTANKQARPGGNS